MPYNTPTRGIPARPWAWPTWPSRCGATISSTTRPIRTGSTATASCCRTATPRCCIYSLLHLTGYDLPIDELKHFRQLHSKTPGHPEVGVTPGVETTTGPLGQGITNAVGMALAEKLLAAEFNRDGHDIVDHHTYVFLGDGCLMEGISHEACALAGAWKLGKLIALYDDNGISIDGQVKPWFIDNTPARFKAYGWNVIGPIDGHDVEAVSTAIAEAKPQRRQADADRLQDADRQGQPEPRQHRQGARRGAGRRRDQADARSAGLAARALRRAGRGVSTTGTPRPRAPRREADWNERLPPTAPPIPELAAEFTRRMKGELPKNFRQIAVDTVVAAHTKAETVASRKASQLALEAFTAALPEMLGGIGRPDRLQPHQHQEHASLRFDLAR